LKGGLEGCRLCACVRLRVREKHGSRRFEGRLGGAPLAARCVREVGAWQQEVRGVVCGEWYGAPQMRFSKAKKAQLSWGLWRWQPALWCSDSLDPASRDAAAMCPHLPPLRVRVRVRMQQHPTCPRTGTPFVATAQHPVRGSSTPQPPHPISGSGTTPRARQQHPTAPTPATAAAH